jgi:protein-disulfide isomerase
MPLDLGSMNLEERKRYLELREEYKDRLLPWYKKWWGIIILVIIGFILILSVIFSLYVYTEAKRIRAENAYNQKVEASANLKSAIYGSGTNYFLGLDKAPLVIVEFSDFACPYCAQAHTILNKIIKRYPGKIKIIYRDLPLHENSVELALGARCAGEQGKFWEMHDQLFANQSILTGTGDELKSVIYSLASNLSINKDNFDACYTSKKYLSNISADFTDGNALELKGTPSWFLNEKLLSGYLPEADYFKLLDTYFFSQK